jgi:hypothetical protein
MGRKNLIVVVRKIMEENPNLPKVIHAVLALAAGFGFGKRREEDSGQDRDDGDDDEQLDEREPVSTPFHMCKGYPKFAGISNPANPKTQSLTQVPEGPPENKPAIHWVGG